MVMVEFVVDGFYIDFQLLCGKCFVVVVVGQCGENCLLFDVFECVMQYLCGIWWWCLYWFQFICIDVVLVGYDEC